MSSRKASDLFVECLEAEGVKYVFGIPGEETLDLNESLEDSSIDFIPVRHEQGGAYMADMYGRLTGRAGVCLGTLGPGATNLITAVADAFLDRAPLVALTGQADLQRMHKESHQHIDIVSMFKPVTKFNTRLNAAERDPGGRAQGVQGGAGAQAGPDAHRVARGRDGRPSPCRSRSRRPPTPAGGEPGAGELLAAAELIANAINPIILAGNGVSRARARAGAQGARARDRDRRRRDFMGKGALDY